MMISTTTTRPPDHHDINDPAPDRHLRCHGHVDADHDVRDRVNITIISYNKREASPPVPVDQPMINTAASGASNAASSVYRDHGGVQMMPIEQQLGFLPASPSSSRPDYHRDISPPVLIRKGLYSPAAALLLGDDAGGAPAIGASQSGSWY